MPYKDKAERLAYWKRYREKHRERRQLWQKEYAKKHHEKLLAYYKYYNKTSPKRREWTRKNWAENKDRLKQQNQEYRQRNLESIRAKRRADYWANREARLISNRKHYEQNRERRIRQASEYSKQNPHVAAKRHAVRRLRVEATIENENAIAAFIKLIRSSRWVYCYYCNRRVSGKKAHIDHVIPLARGGSHKPGNLCASCPPCNLRKSDKLLHEWKRDGQQVLPI